MTLAGSTRPRILVIERLEVERHLRLRCREVPVPLTLGPMELGCELGDANGCTSYGELLVQGWSSRHDKKNRVRPNRRLGLEYLRRGCEEGDTSACRTTAIVERAQ